MVVKGLPMNLNVNASATTDYLGSAALEKLTGIPASTWRYWVLTGEGPESFKLGRRAVSSALRAVALNLLDEHLDHCVSSAIAQGGDEADAKLAEASAAIARLVRS